MRRELTYFTFLALLWNVGYADPDLELVDPQDINLLLEDDVNSMESSNDELKLSEVEELDDLAAIKAETESIKYEDSPSNFALGPELDATLDEAEKEVEKIVSKDPKALENAKKASQKTEIFEVGKEEEILLKESSKVAGKIPASEWQDIASSNSIDKYEVQEGDWLWKISKKLFGSGFYYSKVWAMNPFITNPHEIEIGQVLSFDTGTQDDLPNVRFGEFSEDLTDEEVAERRKHGRIDYSDFSESEPPAWLTEREQLQKDGAYFQFISEENYEDLEKIGKKALITEYQKYTPPETEIVIKEPGEEYDQSGFDKNSKIEFDFSEGFFLNTFVLSNIIVDLGYIDSAQAMSEFIHLKDHVFIRFDDPGRVKPGDLFSVYRPGGKVKNEFSDRSGYKYTVVGQLKAVKKIGSLWECEVFELSETFTRNDRVTSYMSKINKIYKTFSKRMIEATVMDGYIQGKGVFSFGDVVYLDRGRLDGVEIGNVFEVYSNTDMQTQKKISVEPAYKIGELAVISLSDNFATALVTSSKDLIDCGSIVISKTEENAMRDEKLRSGVMLEGVKALETDALDNLDVELNLDNINEDLLDKADKIQLTDDELSELERQERSKSVIKDHEKDLRELERLENEISEAEAELNEAKVDEDKFLEQMNLDNLETAISAPDPDAFGSLDEIEKEEGRKYMDQDINSKENPYGLTEFDLEEINELMETETEKVKSEKE